MMKRFVFLFSGILMYAFQASGAVSLTGGRFDSSFNTPGQCGEFTNTSSSYDPNCDGWEMQASTCGPVARGDSVTTAANYSSGAGGRGYRHWLKCNGSGGVMTGGPLHLLTASNNSEWWLRFYMRPRAGFNPATISGFKFLYIGTTNWSQAWYLHYGWGQQRYGGDGCPSGPSDHAYHNGFDMYWGNATGSDSSGCADYPVWGDGWYTAYGIPADGTWHSHEFHYKLQSPCTAYNGVFEYWLDGVKRWRKTDVKFGECSSGGVGNIIIGSNPGDVGFPTCTNDCDYIDFDDIAFSVNGYIGTIGGPQPLIPMFPQQILIK